jgi:hypothetical protein
LYGAITGPGGNDIPDWAGLAMTYGVIAATMGCFGSPTVIRLARRDRATLAVVRANRPDALILPGAASNLTLLHSLRALGPSAATPRSFLWSIDGTGLTMWQHDSTSPVLIVAWREIVSMDTATMPQGRASIAVVKLSLANGGLLTLALRRRFGGITLMGQQRLGVVLDTFDAMAEHLASSKSRGN